MKLRNLYGAIAIVSMCSSLALSQTPTPMTMTGGRIAISHDGNNWDKDDVLALGMDWAVMAAYGVQDKLVHMEHSVIKCSNAAYYAEMKISEKGPDYFPGFDKSKVFDAWVDPAGRIANFKAEAEKSSANNRLYFLLAGPMELPWQDINAVAKDKRQFITIISHSRANETMGSCVTPSHLWADLKTSFQPDGVVFVQIPDQNANLGGSGSSKWNPLLTLPANPLIPSTAWTWLKGRDYKANGDCSDNGMTWYALTGKTNGTAADYLVRFANPIKPATTAIQVGAYDILDKQTAVSYSQNEQILRVVVNGMKGDGSISMYNILSQNVYKAPIISGQAQLGLGNTPAGKYFLNIESKGQKISKEIRVQ